MREPSFGIVAKFLSEGFKVNLVCEAQMILLLLATYYLST